jgi:hypothetical protein
MSTVKTIGSDLYSTLCHTDDLDYCRIVSDQGLPSNLPELCHGVPELRNKKTAELLLNMWYKHRWQATLFFLQGTFDNTS